MQFVPEHIGLAASDPIALKNWYARTLDAKLVCELNASPPAFLLELAAGWRLEIYQAGSIRSDTSNNQLRGWRHLALRVKSLEKAREELARRGVAFTGPVKPAGGGGSVIFFCDLEGNLLHLVERDAEAANRIAMKS